MDAVRLPDEVKAGVRAALAARDFVALESLLEGTPLKSAEHELLLRFPALRGGPEILDAAGGPGRDRPSEAAPAPRPPGRAPRLPPRTGARVHLDLSRHH